MGVTRAVMEMKAEGMSLRAMRMAVDAMYEAEARLSTPTPYPPA